MAATEKKRLYSWRNDGTTTMKYLIIILILLLYASVANAQATTTGTNDDYYATNTNDVTDGLVLWWTGRQQGLNYAQDVSQYKVQGTITGASWGTGRGLRFDGVNDSVSFGDPVGGHLDPGTGSFGFGGWRRTLSFIGSSDAFISKRDNGVVTNLGYGINTGSAAWSIRIAQGTGTPATVTITSSPNNYLGQWVHIFGVIDRESQTLKAFFNGIQVGTTSISVGSGTVSNSLNLMFGKNPSGTAWSSNCNIDDVRIYNRAPTNDEVNRIYTSNPH